MENPPVSPVNLYRNPVSWLVGIFRRLHGNADPWGDAAAFHTHSHAGMRALSGNPLTNTAAFERFFLRGGKKGVGSWVFQ